MVHDLYPAGSGRYGLHHVAVIAGDIDKTISDAADSGYPLVQDSRIPSMDLRIAMAGTVGRFGHFPEIHRNVPSIIDFYAMIENAAKDFDSTNLLREMNS